MYFADLAALGTALTFAVGKALDAQPAPPDISSVIHQIQEGVVAAGQALLGAISDTVVSLAKAAFVTLLVLGFFLYFTRLHRRLGRDLVVGGVALALILQFVIPAVVRL